MALELWSGLQEECEWDCKVPWTHCSQNLDSEEIASKGINGSEENLIWNWKLRRDRFNNTHTYVQWRDLQSLVTVWGVRNVWHELGDIAKEISQQNVEGATWFLFPDLQLIVRR